MEKSLPSDSIKVNFKKIKDVVKAINDLRDCGVEKLIDLPKIVVIGVQSSGKSSLLEQLVQFEFLPKGTGIVTRCPIEIRLIHSENLEKPYAYFFDEKDKVFEDFAQVRQKIYEITDSKAGKKDITEEPIVLTIFQSNCPTLTLIDLPGMTLNSIDGQSENISQKTLDITNFYISQPKTIILCVIPINNDLVTSLALQIARKADINGDRTIGVLTMIDCMKNGTNCTKELSNSLIPLTHGYYGVKLGNHNEKVSVQQAILNEREFFQNHEHYKSYHELTGTDQLTKKLTSLLESQIQKYLPEIYSDIQKAIEKQHEQYKRLGKPVPLEDSQIHIFFNKLVDKTVRSFKTLLKSTDSDCEENNYPESLIIDKHFGRHYFNHILDNFIESCVILKNQILKNITLESIRIDLKKFRHPVKGFLPFKAFEQNMKHCLKKFQDLSMLLLEQVGEYIEKLFQYSLQTQIYPNLNVRHAISSVGNNMINKLMTKTTKLLKQNFIIFRDTIYSRSNNIITLESNFRTIIVDHRAGGGQKRLSEVLLKDENFLKQNVISFITNATTIKNNSVINSDQCIPNNSLTAYELGERDDIMRYCFTFHKYLENFADQIGDFVPQIIECMMIKSAKKQMLSALFQALLNPKQVNLTEMLSEDVAIKEQRRIIKRYLSSLQNGLNTLKSLLQKDCGVFISKKSKNIISDDSFSFEEIKGADDEDHDDEDGDEDEIDSD